MTIRVRKVGEDRYEAELILPDMAAVTEPWSTKRPLAVEELTSELLGRGCHQTDIGDAMYLADPQWIEKLRRGLDSKKPT